MTDSSLVKEKMTISLGLLGVLFAIATVVPTLGSTGYSLFGIEMQVRYLYYAVLAASGLSFYCYGVGLILYRRWVQVIGDTGYAASFVFPLIYVLLFLITNAIGYFGADTTAPGVAKIFIDLIATAVGFLGLVLIAILVTLLGDKALESILGTFRQREAEALARAKVLFDMDFYDLAIVEGRRSVEQALLRLISTSGLSLPKVPTVLALVRLSIEHNLLPKDIADKIQLVNKVANTLHHKEASITKIQAAELLRLTDQILAAIEVSSQPSSSSGEQIADSPAA